MKINSVKILFKSDLSSQIFDFIEILYYNICMFKRIIYLILLILLSVSLIESVRNKIADDILYPIVHNIGIQSNNATVIIFSGNLKRSLYKFDDAKKIFIYVIRNDDLSKQKNALESAYVNLGHTYYKDGDYSNAAKSYYLALKINPGNKSALMPFVRINMALGNTKQIIPIVDNYILENIKDATGYTELCGIYNRLEEYNSARISCQTAIRKNRHYARAHYDYAVALNGIGFKKDAAKELQLAKKIQPGIKSREALEKILLSVKKE